MRLSRAKHCFTPEAEPLVFTKSLKGKCVSSMLTTAGTKPFSKSPGQAIPWRKRPCSHRLTIAMQSHLLRQLFGSIQEPINELQRSPKFAQAFAAMLARQVMTLRTRLEQRGIHSARDRVRHYLTVNADASGRSVPLSDAQSQQSGCSLSGLSQTGTDVRYVQILYSRGRPPGRNDGWRNDGWWNVVP